MNPIIIPEHFLQCPMFENLSSWLYVETEAYYKKEKLVGNIAW